MNILIVDDDIEDVEVFMDAIQHIEASIQVHHCYNGNQAHEYLRTLLVLPDKIFLDLNMPLMGGVEFLRVIKSDRKFQAIPIVILSTILYEADKEQLTADGASAFIKKSGNFKDYVLNLKPHVSA
jgi:CheY-like chemotaxis protein